MEVNVTKRIDTAQGKRYCPVVVNGSGRIKPDWVVVNGRHKKHREGSYYLEWREEGQRIRISVGNDAAVAFNSQIRKLKELEARAQGLEVKVLDDDPTRYSLRSAAADFLDEIKLSRHEKTYVGYKTSLTYFLHAATRSTPSKWSASTSCVSAPSSAKRKSLHHGRSSTSSHAW